MSQLASSPRPLPIRPTLLTCALSVLLCSLTLLSACLCGGGRPAFAAPHHVETHKSEGGWRLLVDSKPMMVLGMNWGYIPIGENYSWVLWDQPDEVIEEALSAEMALLQAMGVNAIRQYPDIPPRWVEWIYERYGIFTVVNHTLGRYGLSINGVWVPETDYSAPEARDAIKSELSAVVERYKDTRGVLMYLLGNENNYGLSWTNFEAEDLPEEEQDVERARPLYTLFGEVATQIKTLDPHHPVAIANGDLGYIELIAEHCKDVDIMGSNVYRGASSRDLFDRVASELDRPFLYSEFGADAYNARLKREDASAQAEYLRAQWQEIYEHSEGKGRSGVAIGGLIFQWSDGWWKYKQVEHLERHDETATWANRGYPHDYVEGENNMNEEWFGIAAKGPPDERGVFSVYPRPAYYLLKEAFSLDPYRQGLTLAELRRHFTALKSLDVTTPYTAARAGATAEEASRIKVSRLRLTVESGASAGQGRATRGRDQVVGHTQSAYIDVSAQPTSRVNARVSVNLLGQVAQNRLNPIFYENRGRELRPDEGATTSEARDLSALERVALYQAEVEVSEALFKLHAFYRVGHYHWGDEGDFFGLYQEAYYGPNIDMYNAVAPFGMTAEGRGALRHWKVALGPQLYWGANPGGIIKYYRAFGGLSLSFIHHEDVGQNAETGSSNALPIRKSRRTALSVGYKSGGWRLDLGGLFSGSDRVGERFLWTSATSGRGYRDTGLLVHDDRVNWLDTLGAKARLVYTGARWQGYLHGVAKGLVSNAGADPRQRFTGWSLNESGSGNQVGGLAGLAFQLGPVQVAPHVLYQRPLIGPMDTVEDRFNPDSGLYYPALRARNQLSDPFAVLDNRESLAGELLFVYDPTPGTWFWQWDNPLREDADFAASLNVIYRHQPTSRDARFGVNEAGQFFAFDGAPKARDLWEVKGRWVSKVSATARLFGSLFAGEAQSRGVDERVILRSGAELTWLTRLTRAQLSVSLNDWGPYDYHRDYNLTYPLQASGDIGYMIGKERLDRSATRLGLRGLYRALDQHSEGYRDDPTLSAGRGSEWELITYLHVDL